MIVLKTNENALIQVVLLQLEDNFTNRSKLEQLNPNIKGKIIFTKMDEIRDNQSLLLDKTYCFFMGLERLSPIMVNYYMRKLNTFGITSCIYINEEQFANYLIVKKTNNECNCDSFQLFWQGHADSCFYCRKK